MAPDATRISEQDVREALRRVIDPELGINIVDLGLVYGIEIADARVRVEMTMTTPACPLGDYLKELVDTEVRRHLPAIETVEVDLVWDPPWDPDLMSDAARRQLGQ